MKSRARALLALAAAAPFIPGALQFIRRGIPDVLFTGDGATLELRTLHAAHGTQLLGPYSRFQWSHPGPALFYLQLPLYEAFHRHGPALNLFAFLTNLVCAIALVFTARKLRAMSFAFAVATMLAVYECRGADFQLSNEWNPILPILPLGLLSLLAARLALGDVSVLPLATFVASVMVQTHIGYVPVVLALAAVAAGFNVAARYAGQSANDLDAASRRPTTSRRLAVCVLLVLWFPPLLESWRSPPGNLALLLAFFLAPHPDPHAWRVVFDTVAIQLSVMPLGLCQLLGLSGTPSASALHGFAAALVLGLVASFTRSLRRGDRTAAVLSAVALSEMGAAILAVRAIRGDINPYLVVWISMVGLVSTVALATWALPRGAPSSKAARVIASLGALVLFGLSIRAEARRVDVFRAPDEHAESLARDIEGYLTSGHVQGPVLHIASGDAWPTAAAIVLSLHKHEIPFFVEPRWLFMMGEEFAPPAAPRPELLIGEGVFCEQAHARLDYTHVATAGNVCAFMADPDYLAAHRYDGKVALESATGTRDDPARTVDGVVPPEGTPWDSLLSVVLVGTDASVVVRVPDVDGIDGVFLSVDGNDVYAVDCLRADGGSYLLGRVFGAAPIGMGTGLLFADDIASCRAVRISAASGDDHYSVGEIGFMLR